MYSLLHCLLPTTYLLSRTCHLPPATLTCCQLPTTYYLLLLTRHPPSTPYHPYGVFFQCCCCCCGCFGCFGCGCAATCYIVEEFSMLLNHKPGVLKPSVNRSPNTKRSHNRFKPAYQPRAGRPPHCLHGGISGWEIRWCYCTPVLKFLPPPLVLVN